MVVEEEERGSIHIAGTNGVARVAGNTMCAMPLTRLSGPDPTERRGAALLLSCGPPMFCQSRRTDAGAIPTHRHDHRYHTAHRCQGRTARQAQTRTLDIPHNDREADDLNVNVCVCGGIRPPSRPKIVRQ